MNYFIKFSLAIILFINFLNGITCVDMVSLNVPARVRKGSEVQLCLYDLGNAFLYSLKWFSENHKNSEEQEFFRYTPREKPTKQVFPMDGIDVDIQKSDGGTVYLRDVSESASGFYKCKIVVEGTFHTISAKKYMAVDMQENGSGTYGKNMMDQIILQISILFALTWLIF